MALPKYKKRLNVVGENIKPAITPTITNDTTLQNGNISLNQYANAYSQNNKPMQNPYAGGTLNTPNKTIVNETNVNNNIATSGIENKSAIENKPTVDIIPQQSNNVIEETKPLQNAYDSYKAQLELDKLSAQNEVANANKVAQQYMDNYLKYYGMQGSGMGQSAYANLAAQQTQQLSDVNRQYSRDLADYRDSFNQNLKDQASLDLQSLSKEDQQSYINKLRGQSGVNDDTIANIESQANSINYNREQDELEKQQLANDNKNASSLQTGEIFATTMTDEKWNAYLDRLDDDGAITDETIQTLKDFRDAYGISSFETSFEKALSSIQGAIDEAKSNGDTAKQYELSQIFNAINNASNQEELDAALKQWDELEKQPYSGITPQEIGSTSGTGSQYDPLVFDGLSKSDLKDLAENGKLKDGTWVQYENWLGKKVNAQVVDGKLKNKETWIVSGSGTESNPYYSDTKDATNLVENIQEKVRVGELQNGDIIEDRYGRIYVVQNGKVKKYKSMEEYKKQEQQNRNKGGRANDF